MKREDKIKYKRERASRRRNKRNDAYRRRVSQAQEYGCPLHAVTRYGVTGSWADPNSPTGYSQVCSYRGICQSPCNGDC
jgi:hypothetical protein